ncbi:DUF1961 domain-containing protein [Paenibacillus sambharensis]|uniref:DUF1961 domain-containing protein n=1 Tax=Paenibacillus sambharensis TaxID=1803190 RepID=A0A2W1LIP3_9BACL|nr:DUF1961 family protein [Paenibacillus sambharensis]PZD94444.1 DUF1961 domain-containing protein [Paenibacillus sambharensis]
MNEQAQRHDGKRYKTQSGLGAGRLLYENALSRPGDAEGFVMEGDGAVTFPRGRMRLESIRSPEDGQAANIVYWCPVTLPGRVVIEWDFYPVNAEGLAMMFFAAAGTGGEELFDPRLPERNGPYDQYRYGSINAYHISYYRKSNPEERRLQTCNLRKSRGFHLLAQGADPLPAVSSGSGLLGPYRMQIVKNGGEISFSVDGIELFRCMDSGSGCGPVLGGGKIGFRQMVPLIAEYANLRVHELLPQSGEGEQA